MVKLTPVRFDSKLKGGSTRPWSVSCIDRSSGSLELIPCVVKLFTPRQVAQSRHIAKEFICAELAREFDLDTPESYLVDLNDPAFKHTLDQAHQLELAHKHNGITFCSRLVDATLVNEDLKKTAFSIWDCATLFAFDCMIMNADRGGHHKKPNLLMDDDGFILIDHELCLHFLDTADPAPMDVILADFEKGSWPNIYHKHLFYAKLKQYRGANKKNLFDTFKMYLDRLDVNKIEDLVRELHKHGIVVGESNRLIDYLYTIKQKSGQYGLIMQNLIS